MRYDRIWENVYISACAPPGKNRCVAMTACMRGLIILMNRLLGGAAFNLQANTVATAFKF